MDDEVIELLERYVVAHERVADSMAYLCEQVAAERNEPKQQWEPGLD